MFKRLYPTLMDFDLLKNRVANLELEIEKLRTHINSLRGLINRKAELKLSNESEIIKSSDGLDELRHGRL